MPSFLGSTSPPALPPSLPLAAPIRASGVAEAVQAAVDRHEIAGAVSVVLTRDRGIVHLACTGDADVASHRPMTPDTLFWIASMTKPVTGVAVLMLQDEGRLRVSIRWRNTCRSSRR